MGRVLQLDGKRLGMSQLKMPRVNIVPKDVAQNFTKGEAEAPHPLGSGLAEPKRKLVKNNL